MESCAHYDPRYGRDLNGPSRERLLGLIGSAPERGTAASVVLASDGLAPIATARPHCAMRSGAVKCVPDAAVGRWYG